MKGREGLEGLHRTMMMNFEDIVYREDDLTFGSCDAEEWEAGGGWDIKVCVSS